MSQTLWSKKASTKERRRRAIDRLEAQLKLGKKLYKASSDKEHEALKTVDNLIPLEDSDKKRIQKEIETLKTRI